MAYNYLYKEHRDITKEDAEYILTAKKLHEDFLENPDLAKDLYLNKTLVVKGQISEMDNRNLTLDKKVFCEFIMLPQNNFKVGEEMTVKGRCIGFDDLLEQVKLDQCSFIK